MEYYTPTKRQSPILQMLQMRQYMQRPQQHQNPLAQFMGMQQPNALSQYLQPEAGFNPGMAWWMRQRQARQGRQGAPDMGNAARRTSATGNPAPGVGFRRGPRREG